MARVKRSVHSKKSRRKVLEQGRGVPRRAQSQRAQGQRTGHALRQLRVPRPPGAQG